MINLLNNWHCLQLKTNKKRLFVANVWVAKLLIQDLWLLQFRFLFFWHKYPYLCMWIPQTRVLVSIEVCGFRTNWCSKRSWNSSSSASGDKVSFLCVSPEVFKDLQTWTKRRREKKQHISRYATELHIKSLCVDISDGNSINQFICQFTTEDNLANSTGLKNKPAQNPSYSCLFNLQIFSWVTM